ncbi:EGF-like domain protein [Ostertagia ostertagi]
MSNFLILLVLNAIFASHCVDFVARTQRGIALISLAEDSFEAETTLLVPSIPEELSVLLAVDASGTCYFTLRNHLYSLTTDNSTTNDLGRIGYGLEEAPSSIAFDWVTKKEQAVSSSKDVTYSSLTLDLSSRRIYFVRTQRKSSQIWYCELYHRDSCVQLFDTDPIQFFTVYKILFISAVSGIYQISLDTADFTPKQVLFEGLNNDGFSHKFYDIDFDPVERKIYWIDASVGRIRRCFGNGSSAEDVLSIPNSVRVFRLDYLARNVYWIDAGVNRLYVTLAPYAWPNGIAVDAEHYRLYWTEGNYSVVRTAFLNGTAQVVIGPASLKLPQPYAISTLGQELFCNSLAGRALMRISANEETVALTASVIESSIYGPIGLVAVSLHSTVSNVSSCAQLECMHLCVVSSQGMPKCLCSTGFELMSDERTCRKPSSYFVMLQEDVADISRASLEKPLNFDSLDILNITEPPTTADIDQRGNYLVYGYSSTTNGYIKRASFTGAVPETVVNDPTLRMPLNGDSAGGTDIVGDLAMVRSLAIDYRKDLLYWTELDHFATRISVSKLNDSNPCTYELSDCPQLCLATSRIERLCLCSDHFTFDQYSLLCKAPDNIIVAGSDEGFVVMNLRRLPDQSLSYHETSVFPDRHNCSIFHSLAIDENGRALYASCHSRAGIGYVYVFRVRDTHVVPLELIGKVVSGTEVSLATGHAPVPRDITVLPQSNYLFYVDVSPFLPSPAIIQCQLDGRKCEAWLSKDLWPGTRIYVDPAYLRLFYTCPSGIWSRDVGVVSSNVRHHFVSSVANDYSVAPLDETAMLVAQISSNNSTIIELPSNSTVDLTEVNLRAAEIQ